MENKKVKLTMHWIINGSTIIKNTWTPWLTHLSWRIRRSQTNRLRAEDTATLSYRPAGNPNFDRSAELHFDFKKNAWYALESVSHRYHNVSRETISLVQTEEGHVITRISDMKRSQWMMLRLPWWYVTIHAKPTATCTNALNKTKLINNAAINTKTIRRSILERQKTDMEITTWSLW